MKYTKNGAVNKSLKNRYLKFPSCFITKKDITSWFMQILQSKLKTPCASVINSAQLRGKSFLPFSPLQAGKGYS